MSATFFQSEQSERGHPARLSANARKLLQWFSIVDFTPDFIRALRSSGQDARAPTRNHASLFLVAFN
jgi:hypothetical protein